MMTRVVFKVTSRHENLKSKLYHKDNKEIIWSLLSKGSTVVFFLSTNIYLARSLGVGNYGLWSLFLSVITIVFTFSYFGINPATGKFVAQYNETVKLKGVLLTSIKLRLLISLFFAITFFLAHRILADILGYPELTILFYCGVPLIFLSGLVEYLKAVYMGLHRIKYFFIVSILEHGLKFIFVVGFLYISNSVISVVNSYAFALLITCCVGFYFLYSRFYKVLESNDYDFKKDIINYSYPFIFISIGTIASTEIDTVMLGVLSTTNEVGIYAVAKQIVLKTPHLALAIAMGTTPVFAKLNNRNKGEFKNKFKKLFRNVSGIYIIIALSIIFISPIIIPMVFSVEYTNSVLPLQILSLYSFMFAVVIIIDSVLNYTGKAKVRAYSISIVMVLNVLLNYCLIPIYGAVGAAMATTISFIPYLLINWFEVRKVFA